VQGSTISTGNLEASHQITGLVSRQPIHMQLILVSVTLLTALSAAPAIAQTGQTGAVADFKEFWRTFRSAVVRNDQKTIVSLTHFPFRTLHCTDSDDSPAACPSRQHGREWFHRLLTQLLDMDSGHGTDDLLRGYHIHSMRRFIENTMVVPNRSGKEPMVDENSACVANFEFERVKGKWLFTAAYWDEASVRPNKPIEPDAKRRPGP
jgi:hypothetical protein